jgi:hypothetical protein
VFGSTLDGIAAFQGKFSIFQRGSKANTLFGAHRMKNALTFPMLVELLFRVHAPRLARVRQPFCQMCATKSLPRRRQGAIKMRASAASFSLIKMAKNLFHAKQKSCAPRVPYSGSVLS